MAVSQPISGLTLQARSLKDESGDGAEDVPLYEVNGLPPEDTVFIRKVGEEWRILAVRGAPLAGLTSMNFRSATEALVVLHASLL